MDGFGAHAQRNSAASVLFFLSVEFLFLFLLCVFLVSLLVVGLMHHLNLHPRCDISADGRILIFLALIHGLRDGSMDEWMDEWVEFDLIRGVSLFHTCFLSDVRRWVGDRGRNRMGW